MLKDGHADVLIAYRIDRIVRPPEEGDEWDMPLLIRGLAKLNKEIHTVNRGQLKTDFASLLIAMLDARKAGEERRDIVERTTRGKTRKAQSGKVVGGGPVRYGYTYVYERTSNGVGNTVVGLAINVQEAAIIRDIFTWYVGGLSAHAIAKRLSEMKVPTPGISRKRARKRDGTMWSRRFVIKVLTSEVYIGRLYYGPDKILVPVPAIIDLPIWKAAQRRIHDKASKLVSHRKTNYLVAGRIKCGCGCHMVGQSGGNGHNYYRCTSSYCKFTDIEERGCDEKMARQDLIDALAWIFALCSKKSYAEFLDIFRRRQEEQQQEIKPLEEQRQGYAREIAECARKIKNIASLMGDLDPKKREDQDALDAFRANLKTLSSEKTFLERKLDETDNKLIELQPLSDRDIDDALALREREISQLNNATFEEQRRYIEKIDLRVKVKNGFAHFSCRLNLPEMVVSLDEAKRDGVIALLASARCCAP